MKKLLLLLSIIFLNSCEEVIDVDLTTSASRLVIDASINWEKGTSGNIQTIRISTTTGYYQTEIPKVTGATVYVTNSFNNVFVFNELNTGVNTGKYVCTNFIPEIGETYTLTIIYNGKTYTASEKLLDTPSITDVEQRNDLGLNSDEIGIKVNFNDFPNQSNFYLSRFESTVNVFPEYETLKDEFSQGNTISTLFSNEDLATSDVVNIAIYGVSEMYYNYMKLIIGNTNSNGPFQTPPTSVRGNIINQTDEDDYVLGYFRLGEVDKLEYIVQ
ncbi:DUF4249 domain-containing protein [Mariniflexile sp.]|uniref:DUF4249 domain-containing protein n=1 Tax=Mariniflexile sp. TaxID=1979402 RepID=UPI00404802A3